MLHPHYEACILVLIWEWWLGHQAWLRAKSTIALIVLILAGITFFVFEWFKPKKEK